VVVGVGLETAAFSLDLRHGPDPLVVELTELHHPDVVGVALGLGADSQSVTLGMGADGGGTGSGFAEHVVGLLLGQPQHLTGAAAETGVRRGLVLGEPLAQADVLGLEGAKLLLGFIEAGDQAGLLRRRCTQVPVNGFLVVAPLADQRQRRRVGGSSLRRHQRCVRRARDARRSDQRCRLLD
jgi:hypothetical protein